RDREVLPRSAAIADTHELTESAADGGVLMEHRVEARLVEAEQVGIHEGAHGGSTCAAGEQRHLPEAIAGAHLHQSLAVSGHLDAPRTDEVEAVAIVSLADDIVAGLSAFGYQPLDD